MRPLLVLLLLCLSIPALADEMTPVDGPTNDIVLGSAFTYQGRLVLNGTPVNGGADIRISLWDAAAAGSQIGVDQNFLAYGVVEGMFSVELDFGAGAFAGDARWIEIEVRSPAGVGGYTTLAPRQEINAVPYALHALNGGGGGGSAYWDLQAGFITNTGSAYVLINRTNRIGSEWFGIHAPTTSYGGMYISTDGDNGKPFYGYQAGDSPSMWTYHDGATLEWRVNNGADRRFTVHNNGLVGVGNTITFDDNDNTNTGGSIELRKNDGTVGARIWGAAGSGSQGGTLALYNDTQSVNPTVVLDGEYGNPGGGALLLRNETGTTTIELAADLNPGDRGLVRMYKPDGTKTLELDANETGVADQGATIKLYDDAGNLTIEMDGDYGAGGEGRITTEVIEITGGADFSEQFDVSCGSAAPGSVVSIDPSSPGQLCLSSAAYDRRVAGIISGAGGVKPGLLMGQRGTEADGQHPVALTGRVYCKVDASYGSIEPGDLLTTSPTTGHAMKVTDHSKATGAILGKAMTTLESGRGLVLVLVSLQ